MYSATYSSCKGVGQKKGFHLRPIMWASYFGPWDAGLYNFPCGFGWVPLPFQQATGSPFSPKSYLLKSIYTFLYLTFSSFSTVYPNFCSFYALGPTFVLFILEVTCCTLVTGLSTRGGHFGVRLPPKIESLAKTFLLPPPPRPNAMFISRF